MNMPPERSILPKLLYGHSLRCGFNHTQILCHCSSCLIFSSFCPLIPSASPEQVSPVTACLMSTAGCQTESLDEMTLPCTQEFAEERIQISRKENQTPSLQGTLHSIHTINTVNAYNKHHNKQVNT